MMNTNEHDLRMAQHLQNTLAINNINDFDPNSQDQHHSRSQNNKNYRTPTSTPSFSNQNKQSVKICSLGLFYTSTYFHTTSLD